MRSRLATSWSFCVTLGCSRAWADARSCSGNSGRSWGSPMLRRKRVVVLVLPRVTRGISDMIAAGFHMTLWIRRGVVALVLLAGVSVYALQRGSGSGGGSRGGADDEEDPQDPTRIGEGVGMLRPCGGGRIHQALHGACSGTGAQSPLPVVGQQTAVFKRRIGKLDGAEQR